MWAVKTVAFVANIINFRNEFENYTHCTYAAKRAIDKQDIRYAYILNPKSKWAWSILESFAYYGKEISKKSTDINALEKRQKYVDLFTVFNC